MPDTSPLIDSWNEEHTIRAYEVDAHGLLSLPSLCNLLQNAAGNHARQLQLSIDDLLEQNCTWVLSRLAVRIDGSAGWGDRINVRTWASGIEKLFAMRDFACFDAVSKKPLASAVSAWLIIDTESRRPLRVRPHVEHLHMAEGSHVLDIIPGKFPPPETSDCERLFRVGFSDMDVNRHVNNVRYITWAYETVPREIHEGFRPSYLEINYLGEALYNDELRSISCTLDSSSPSFLHSVVRISDEKEMLRAMTRWEPIES